MWKLQFDLLIGGDNEIQTDNECWTICRWPIRLKITHPFPSSVIPTPIRLHRRSQDRSRLALHPANTFPFRFVQILFDPMNIKSLSSWLLVFYLALLLSCGEGLHRVPFLGHHLSSGSVSENRGHATTCQCRFHAQCHPGGNSSGPLIEEAGPAGEIEPCLICEFFSEFQALEIPFETPSDETPAFVRDIQSLESVEFFQILAVSRGPPAVGPHLV